MIFCLFGVEMKIGISFSFSEFKFNPAGAFDLKSELVSNGGISSMLSSYLQMSIFAPTLLSYGIIWLFWWKGGDDNNENRLLCVYICPSMLTQTQFPVAHSKSKGGRIHCYLDNRMIYFSIIQIFLMDLFYHNHKGYM